MKSIQFDIVKRVLCLVLFIAILDAYWEWFEILQGKSRQASQDKTTTTREHFRMFQSSKSIAFHVYLFNFTNPILDKAGEKPKLNRIGPYVFQDLSDIQAPHFQNSSTFNYEFSASFSDNRSLTDIVTLPNIEFITLSLVESYAPKYVLNSARNMLINGQAPQFVQKTVQDVLLPGFQEPLFEQAERMFDINILQNISQYGNHEILPISKHWTLPVECLNICSNPSFQFECEVQYSDVEGYRFSLKSTDSNKGISSFECENSHVMPVPFTKIDSFDAHFDVEPYTGTILEAKKTVQLNMALKQVDHLKTTVASLPFIQVEKIAKLEQKFVSELKTVLRKKKLTAKLLPLWICSLTVVLILVWLYFTKYSVAENENPHQLMTV